MMHSLIHHALYPLKRFEIRSLRQRCTKKRAIVLTYDDGPCPRMTSEVLGVLDDSGAHATFFVVGNCVDTHPDVLRRIQNAGHEIGSHSMKHLHALKVDSKLILDDFKSGIANLSSHGVSPQIFRPPYGKLLWNTRRACDAAKCRIGWWTLDSGDSAKHIPTSAYVVDQIKRAGGGVVLMHDLDRTGQQAELRESHTIETTRALLKLAADEDYTIMTMGDLLGLSSLPPSQSVDHG